MIFPTFIATEVPLGYRLIAPVALSGVDHAGLASVSQSYLYQLLLAFCGFINRVCKIHAVSPKLGRKKTASAGGYSRIFIQV